jgi:hypothetical protein
MALLGKSEVQAAVLLLPELVRITLPVVGKPENFVGTLWITPLLLFIMLR